MNKKWHTIAVTTLSFFIFFSTATVSEAAQITNYLHKGSSGEQVYALQSILQSAGYLNVAPTSYFGSLTFQAVEAFQSANGISVTGTVGPITRAALNSKFASNNQSTGITYANGNGGSIIPTAYTPCIPSWSSGNWSACAANGTQTRVVTDANNCGVSGGPGTWQTCPYTPTSCSNGLDITSYSSCSCPSGMTQSGTTCITQSSSCSATWSTGDWSTCDASGKKARTVTQSNTCSDTSNKPVTTSSCTYSCAPSWTMGDWGACASNGTQSRTVTDANSCGTTAGSDLTTRTCTFTPPTSCVNGLDVSAYPSCTCPSGQSQVYDICTAAGQTQYPTPSSKTSLIRWMYSCILGRTADAGGISYYTSNQGSISSFFKGIFDSAEYLGDQTSNTVYINQLYNCVLFRTIKTTDGTYWADQLKSGVTRDSVLNNMLISQEFTTGPGATLHTSTGMSL